MGWDGMDRRVPSATPREIKRIGWDGMDEQCHLPFRGMGWMNGPIGHSRGMGWMNSAICHSEGDNGDGVGMDERCHLSTRRTSLACGLLGPH